jgi:hypothetical protein
VVGAAQLGELVSSLWSIKQVVEPLQLNSTADHGELVRCHGQAPEVFLWGFNFVESRSKLGSECLSCCPVAIGAGNGVGQGLGECDCHGDSAAGVCAADWQKYVWLVACLYVYLTRTDCESHKDESRGLA